MGWESSDRRQRLPAGWSSKIVPRIKKRDGYQCTWMENGKRCTGRADEVDHRKNNDDHSDGNLRSLCTPHHDAKSAAEGVAERARREALRKRPVPKHPGLL